MTEENSSFSIAIAGASGFVGRALIKELQGKHRIIGLSRSRGGQRDGIEWRQCDLFSLKQTESALSGCDIAIYLVHSMLPAAKLTQGKFNDLDLMIADNFARAARKHKIQRIIYLGGLIPEGKLSLHLQSRREVEDALGSYGVPCTTLRAGLIVGADGSSFNVMKRLVERLPVMICPKWTLTRTQPIALKDVTTIISKVIDDTSLPPGAYDIGGADVLTYIGMMRTTADVLGKKRRFIPVMFLSPKLSRLWVWLVTGAPDQLIGPLVESLRHEMICRNRELATRYGLNPVSFAEALRTAVDKAAQIALEKSDSSHLNTKIQGKKAKLTSHANSVCSIQRLPLPKGRNAEWIAKHYTTWLIAFLYPVIRVESDEIGSMKLILQLGLRRWSWPLLVLRYSAERSSVQRQLFYIEGGLLRSRNSPANARFEFREVLCGRNALAAIFDFVPSLPWWLYKRTQAQLHLFVMWAFKMHIRYHIKRGSDPGNLPARDRPWHRRQ